jgi:hypothetical protein
MPRRNRVTEPGSPTPVGTRFWAPDPINDHFPFRPPPLLLAILGCRNFELLGEISKFGIWGDAKAAFRIKPYIALLAVVTHNLAGVGIESWYGGSTIWTPKAPKNAML